MPLILPGNVASATAASYDVDNSCRFNNDDSAYMHRTPAGGGTSNTTFTWSIWIKRTDTATAIGRLFEFYNTSSYYVSLRFRDDVAHNLEFYSESNGAGVNLRTNRQFRDVGAWYHIVMRVDTTNGTDDDRLRMYVNGVQETSFAARTNPGSSEDLDFNGASDVQYVGRKWEDSDYFDGYMAEVCYCDGQSLAPTSFGEFDSASPTIWKPKDVSGLTFGTNGFYLDFKDSANLGNDANGGTDLTEVNLDATDQATDTPTNNFCILNAISSISRPTLKQGNCSLSSNASDGHRVHGTIASKTGYFEVKLGVDTIGASGKGIWWGVMDATNNAEPSYNVTTFRCMKTNYGYNTHFSTANFGAGNTWEDVTTGLDSDIGDILMCAWKNGKVYFGYNGTWFFSADPSNDTDGSTQIPLVDSNAYQLPVAKSDLDGLDDSDFNFGGCPAFAISSGNADANGYGNFEYAPPTGCYALCTKNLAEFG